MFQVEITFLPLLRARKKGFKREPDHFFELHFNVMLFEANVIPGCDLMPLAVALSYLYCNES
jgi:hypothetical protein